MRLLLPTLRVGIAMTVEEMEDIFDIIIIGGGPAGLTAGLYARRAGMKTLLLEKTAPGGLIALTERVENYPGFPEGINGYELVRRMEEQAKRFGLVIESGEVTLVKSLPNEAIQNGKASGSRSSSPQASPFGKIPNPKSQNWEIITAQRIYSTRTVIIATGTKPRKLGVSGEEKLTGRGVSYCATCDGPLFRDREVVVVGGGDAALEEALFLTKFARRVFIVHRRDQLRASQILQDRVLNQPEIKVFRNSVIQEIIGSNKVEAVRIKNLVEDKMQELSVAGVFVFIGFTPQTGFIKDLITLDAEGYIITDDQMQTSREGIYACGDVRKKSLRQVVTACSEGALAAYNAAKYVSQLQIPMTNGQIPRK